MPKALTKPCLPGGWLMLALALSPAMAQTGDGNDPGARSLSQVFAAAWERQPEAKSLELRREVAEAQQQTADSWTAERPSLELSSKTDQLNADEGSREYVAGVAIPLWLPGERSRSSALAQAESRAVISRFNAAQLRTAAAVREAWWNWQRARGEHQLAREQLANAEQIAGDVRRRVKAGDLARADQHQAEAALAGAEATLAEAGGALLASGRQLRTLAGLMPDESAVDTPEAMPDPARAATMTGSAHPGLAELLDRAEIARRSADLASVQTWSNPELLLATTRERGPFDNSWDRTMTFGVRIPFGLQSRNRARSSLARAEALEAEEQLRLESERLLAEIDAADAQLQAARSRLAAAERRARLAGETRGFFEKSFRMGETDLPTRLRIELEAVEADKQASRARIDLAAAISTLRQVLGLLPEQQ
ncbi:MAG: TolC family protein [Gammaproteobacteria bacterium]|jgi:cobalt-zinc-cadmium efflux system outer membrane protein|nr:TolC family protein [Gammaproteobacteria bacterium]